MGPDSIHFETIDLIRQITSDGKLEVEEVWDLGDHLNNNRLARKRWPGKHLWPILQQIFEDNVVTGEEMRMLGEEICRIEEICSDITERVSRQKPKIDLSKITVSPLEAPVVERTVYQAIRGEDKRMYASNLRDHSCNCKDWAEVHEVIPSPGLGRLCKHLVDALREVHEDEKADTSQWPDAVANIIYILHRFKLPAEPVSNWQFLEWGEHDAFVAYGYAEWASVFANTGESRYERFGYHVEQNRWSFGVQPPDAETLAGYFQHQLDPFAPERDVR